MCGSLHHNEIKPGGDRFGRIGDYYRVKPLKEEGTESLRWDGFARRESIPYWKSEGWKPALVVGADGYTEKGRFYPIGTTRKIAAVAKDRKFRILTRPAKGAERKVHNRWPVIVKRRTPQ